MQFVTYLSYLMLKDELKYKLCKKYISSQKQFVPKYFVRSYEYQYELIAR